MKRYLKAALCSFLLSPAFAAAQVAIEWPATTGPHRVGTMSLHVVDESRDETLTEEAGDVRELMIQIWYPAASVAGLDATRLVAGDEEVVAATFGPRAANPMGITPAVLEELRSLRTGSYPGAAPLAGEARFPVLLFSHGFGGFRNQNRFQTEELASHGFVVVGIDHTYCASAVRFPDGRLATFAPGFDLRDTSMAEEERDRRFEALVRIWARDAITVLDELVGLAGVDGFALAGRLALDRVGIFGHSFGGATAGQVMVLDDRFAAGINMDGMPYGSDWIEGVGGPFLFLRAERLPPDPAMLGLSGMSAEQYEELFDEFDRRVAAVAESSPFGVIVRIRDTKHFNFSDFPILAPASAIAKAVAGPLDAARGVELINRLTREFFDKALLGRPAPLFEGSPLPWEEAELEIVTPSP
jgi:dienelactone hydrolase